MKRTTRAAYAAGIALTATLTGCGGSDFADESMDDIVAAAQKDMGDLESVRMVADITSDGQNIKLDMALNTSGNCEGSVSVGDGTAQVIRLDESSWFKADEAFWRAQAGEQADQIIAIVGDKWVADPRDQFGSFCDLDDMLEEIADEDEVDGGEKDGTAEVDGEDAVKLVNDEDGKKVTIYVATDEPHYILKVEMDGDDVGSATFSDFDEDIDVEAPPEDETVELPGA
jgi:hypothetical protein